jgi:hypothetical protein
MAISPSMEYYMASTKLTFGAILNTVSTTANTITNTIGALGVGANMLAAYADKAHAEQTFQYKLDMAQYKQTARATSALEVANQAEEINKAKAKSPEFAKSFDHFFEMFSAIE